MPEPDGEREPSLLAKVSLAVILAAIAVVVLYGFAHSAIPAIHPGQKPPKRHFAGRCGLCHTVSASAKLVKP